MITRQKARRLREIIEQAVTSLTDEVALDAIELYPAWEPDQDYLINERIKYENKLYRVVQAHTSQNGWEPPTTKALFTEVVPPGEIPVWVQPTGVQDAYMSGDKVWYPDRGDQIFVSTIDYNTWQPGVYGWEEE